MSQISKYLLGKEYADGTLPSFEKKSNDVRSFQQHDRSNPIAQKQIGSTALAAFIAPNNPYQKEAEQSALQNVYNAVTDPMAATTVGKGRYFHEESLKPFERAGYQIEHTASPTIGADGERTIVTRLTSPSGKIGYKERTFYPEGEDGKVTLDYLIAPNMGIASVAHGAESQAAKELGGVMETTLADKRSYDTFKRHNPLAQTDGFATTKIEYPGRIEVDQVGHEYYDKLHADNPKLWEEYNTAISTDPQGLIDKLTAYNQSKGFGW